MALPRPSHPCSGRATRPPGPENARSQRTGRGIVSDRWSITTHEFITEKADYAGQKFRVLVEVKGKDAKK